MQFSPTRYLEAVKAMDFSGVECNLAFSDAHCPYSLAELGITARIFEKDVFHSHGDPELKEQIAKFYGVKDELIMIPSGGSTLSNFLFAAALLDRGDKVLVEEPTYEPLKALALSTGAEVGYLSRSPQRNYDLDLDECMEMMKPSVKLVILTRLHNPSGRDIPTEVLLQLAEKAYEIDAFILVDEIYLDFMPVGQRTPAAALHPCLLTTNSFTKVFGLGGLRFGWGIGPKDLIWECQRIHNLLGAITPVIPEQIALELYKNGGIERIAASARRLANENIPIVEKWMSNQPRLSWVKPDGGIIAAVRLKGVENSDPFLAMLKEKYRTMVMPGKYFDLPDGFRLGFGVPPHKLEEGLRRIELALNEIG
jgi:aspartate/methionine/tyrosine aminotransferase